MAELSVAVVSAERGIWYGNATSIVAKTPEGDIGILPGHEPVLALLQDSLVRVTTAEGTVIVVAAHGGFLSVAKDEVNIIAEVAELAADIDIERAKAALARAQAAGEEPDEQAALKRAETRLAAASKAGINH
jgi:F-type H+-transporting ATPase subunit epsilon